MNDQSALVAEWREGLQRGAAAAADLTGELTETQVMWVPPDGGWSIAQVLEHLAVTNEQYLTRIRAVLPRVQPSNGRAWRPSLAGRMLAHALVSPRKARAPGAFQPGPVASPASGERFIASVDALLAELERAAGADLRTRIHSPASKLIPLNLGDAFRLQVLHADRHLDQVRRIMRRDQFPG